MRRSGTGPGRTGNLPVVAGQDTAGPDLRAVPDRMAMVLAFVNTHAGRDRPDLLDDDDDTRTWLATIGWTDVAVDELARRRLRELREALRTTLLAHVGVVDEDTAAAALAPVCEGATLQVVIGDGAAAEVAGSGRGLDGLVNELLASVAVASIDGTWTRMKACVSADCHTGFWDGTKNRSGRYCSAAGCANRARQREFRARQRSTAER